MHKTATLWLAASILWVTYPAFANVPRYALIPQKSFIKFFAIQNNVPLEGKFSDFDVDIRFDPEQLDQSSITVEVRTGSIAMFNQEVLQNVRTSDWLSVDAFPKATFKSHKITRMTNTDNYYADGTLTLRDKTVPVVLNFKMDHIDNRTAIASGYATLHRRKFGVGQGEWANDEVIKDEVRVEFRVAAEKK